MTSHRLAAFKVERRSVAVAVFIGLQLDYTQTRQLSAAADKATASTVGFASWVIATFGIQSAAVELLVKNGDLRRGVLTNTLLETFRQAGAPVWEVSKPDLLQAYGVPSIRTRKELRQIVTSIWPILDHGKPNGALDATALGLWVQTERLFLQ